MESLDLVSVSRSIFASLGLEGFKSPLSLGLEGFGHSLLSWDFEYCKEMA